ncbi:MULTISPECIES: tRNA uracil 4-sulfurtransferase ThiI [unclassified Oleiphilus]|jgi:thiamine biosynthesis protein ThiI|uniref:tRNA uracil 4-sulfurtransferase ThiI n=3 Tax=Oleiphilus TaxID=141450 RepID=UPI0007C228F8|nr:MULTISPECIES: tRNA uracil 4-sulfurtransferase ThiI [unclassified Oleiphilus]KZY44323.1 tRNA 4-thiouridine(8) synthase ThiI [Oleiphilus sp. HI0050]KZY72831.1 tRNA 4-thiouridine(8) synthase ThiI [Oleiphilus sp. HI0068]KZY75996.1 tRNA 4-thiouridine(8) synthase ThiI [Oleiphilus sp. HI0069]KZY87952.1 tRNA 4-thiouridine(8) synthase ThiI [Oleiphilus sp. HI0072]KZZ12033.1 tRNA 4-thiouridine(8) synthase ThiI [Oleiphilus sp. HI0078]
MKFVVKLFPEITIKSKPVRQRLVKQLRQNISAVLKKEFEDVKVQGFWDKIEVNLNDDSQEKAENLAATLQRIPGIANILRVQRYQIDNIDDNFDEIVEHTHRALGEELKGKRFVVRIKRAGQHSFTSHELERYVGGGLLRAGETAGVDLHNPEVTVMLEVRDSDLYIIEQRYEGLGGYPIGAQDDVLSLMSGGFDSTVASYLTMKRGLKTHFCFFNLGGAAHEIGVKQVALYLWEKYGVSHRVKFVAVPFEEVVAEILKNVHHSQMGVILKRMMLRAAEKVADQMGIEALVMGDSVAQVSSQTLANMSVINKVTDTLVLRPLITMDKQDIISLSAKIGTEEFAKNMPEYCGVISDRPTTRAKMERILEEEDNFDFEVLERAVEQRVSTKIDEVMSRIQTIAEVDLVNVPEVDDVIIDIRHPDEVEKSPLVLTNNEIKNIAFYELMSKLDQLEADQQYLLYCEKGTMSQLHASHLKGMGYEKIGVYAP